MILETAVERAKDLARAMVVSRRVAYLSCKIHARNISAAF